MTDKQHQDRLRLECESLEERQMLSTVDVFAAGVTNEETIELQIDGVTVQTWENVGGDAFSGEFVKLSFSTPQDVDPGQIRIAFTNDLYDEAAGIDRNVRIDRIVVDGETIETESAEVFSTGTWKSTADGIVPGFGRGDILHANGYFQFPASQIEEPGTPGAADGSIIQVTARGSEGTESFNLVIKGRTVATFDAALADQTFSYTHTDTVSADDVRIEFFNDRWEPESGIDANLIVDKINIDGTDYQTEAPSVFSTGTWKAAEGIVPGNRESETLHANGYFQFAGDATPEPPTPEPPTPEPPTPEPPTPEPPAPSNVAPVANNDVGNTTQADTAITLDVLTNDFDADSDALTIVDAGVRVAQGTVAIVDNQLVYTPAGGFDRATAAISYTVSDGTDTDTARAFVFVSPVSTPTPPTSTGLSFVTEATVRFDDLDGGVWQRVFDFGNGPGQDNLLLTQLAGSNTMRFDLYANGQVFSLDAVGGIVEGETATWKAQVTDAGVMQLFKDGTLVSERNAVLVPDVARANLLVGESNWSADTPLIGQVVSISADIDGDGTTDLSQNTTPNPPSPVPPTPEPPAPEPPAPNPPTPSNLAPVATNDVGNTTQAGTAITLDVLANDFDADNDDLTIVDANVAAAQGTVAVVDNRLVYTPADGFDSVTAAISYTVSDGTDTSTARAFVFVSPVSTPAPPTSNGLTFVTEATARFDDLDGGVWQRVFDFGNGPGRDNVLLTQLGGSNTMRFDLYADGQIFTLDAVGGIVEGETETWKAQVTDTGVMQLFKNGTLLSERGAVVVPGVGRANLLVGESNWSADTPLIGQVLSISADIDGDGTTDLSQNTAPNPPTPVPPTPVPPTPQPTPPNIAPNANDDPGNVTNANTAITLNVLANDTDADDNALTITDASVPSSQGTVTIANNQLVYTPADGFGGVTTEISYTISDGNGGSDSATAFVYVIPGNTQPPTPAPPTPAPPTPQPPTPQPPTPAPPTPQPPTTSGLSFFTEVTAQFNAVNFSSQRIFDYGNGFNKDSIYLGQIGASNDLQFGFFSNGQLYTLDAPGAIVQRENATWRIQVTDSGLMQLFKNDVLLAERQAVAVPDLPRKFLMVGISTDNSAPKFIGAISSITADINGDGNPDKVGTEALKFNPDDEVATSPTFATDRRPAKNTPISGNPIIDTLTWSMQWDADVITWAFEEHDLDNDGINDWEEGNWRNFYEGMMADVTTYTGLRFVEQPRTNAVVTFRLNPTGGGGISRTPNNGGVKTDTQVGINPSDGMETITDIVYPGQFSEAFYHELGHALGFDHPTADGFDFGPISGENAFISSGPTGLNSKLYSVMTYANFFWAEDNPFTPQFDTKTVQQMWPGSYLPFDIAAFQFMYGVNTTHALGDDIYTFNDDRRQSAGLQAIWDNGGTDTIQYTGSSRTVINLNDATLQREVGGGGFLSTSESLTTGYLIANGVVVENAIGGNNADILTGNEFANELVGNGGNDTLNGGGGNDILIGGAGDNTIRGGTGFDIVVIAGTQGGAQVSNNGGGNFVIRAQDGSIARVSGVEEVRFLGGGSLTLQSAEPDFFFSPSPPVAEILRANLPTVQVSSADVAPEALNYVYYNDLQEANSTSLNDSDHNHNGDDCDHAEHGEMLADLDSGESDSHAHEDGCGCAACVAAASSSSSMLRFAGESD